MSAPIVVIGRSGQVARALAALSRIQGRTVVAVGRPDADLARPDSLAAVLVRYRPALVINAGAFTAVDAAEAHRSEAFAVNAAGPGYLARACAAGAVPLIHVSSDYVFDGAARRPYREDDAVAPLSAYGASKAEGEAAVRAVGGRHVIVRTSWVYSETGRSFLTTMLAQGRAREELAVVDDQHGSPTYAADVASAIARIVEAVVAAPGAEVWGTYHFASAGSTTWYGFAGEIFARAEAMGWKTPRLRPIATADYPTPAHRPAYSVLDCGKIERVFGINRPDWRDGLERCMRCLAPSERVTP